jgi:hypothetical protein
MKRHLYTNSIAGFINDDPSQIIGNLITNYSFDLTQTQRDAWKYEIELLKNILPGTEGAIYFEYSIPRMGKRIDVVLIIKNVVFVIEFKVGEAEFTLSAIDQVWDYALDLKNFHDASHKVWIAPVIVATKAKDLFTEIVATPHNDNLLFPIKTNLRLFKDVVDNVLAFADGANINTTDWDNGRYSPTPTIIEAAMALYNNHSVADISRSDASAKNLTLTTKSISAVIHDAKTNSHKSICFVTGVPGAGKTLVGLDIATKNMDKDAGTTSVFLSGNGPLVSILREALTRDRVKREKAKGNKVKKGEVSSEVKVFIQNVHHFRDDCLADKAPPIDHVAIFDEAQRAWNHEQTASFMLRKKGTADFMYSEPEFLVSCLDRHKDWAVVVCLVGGGQEINTGEAGISEWIESINRSFKHWKVFVSSRLTDSEYAAGNALHLLENNENVFKKDELHLDVSMRSFRAEHLSELVKNILDLNIPSSTLSYNSIKKKYPFVITRDLNKAKKWLKAKARGSERYGIVVSSQAQRLKPHAIDVKTPIDPIHWFLDDKDDVRSSYYLEDVATEFHVQGLELDWACVVWDADFRYTANGWQPFSFVGSKWHNIKKDERKQYLKNAYRVLLTRARQGMVIVIPEGNSEDHTRKSEYYDSTYNYLKEIGIEEI